MSETIDIPDIKESVYVDYENSSEIENIFHIEKLIGKGGSGNVYKSKIMKNDKRLNLNYGMDIALKLCNSYLTYNGCISYKDEAKFTNIFSNFNSKKICYNYPIVYGFFHNCLFFTKDESDFIIEYMEKNNVEKCKDAFILYCVTPEHIILDKKISLTLIEHYDLNFLYTSRKNLPKTDNSIGLYEMSISSMSDWTINNEVYDYLFSLPDLKGCDMFLLLQYLKGFSLSELKKNDPTFKFTDTLFFESVYSTMCAAFTIKFVQSDKQPDNAMIVSTNNPRIYLYKEKYHIITGDIFYWIDFNGLSYIENIVKSDIKFYNFFTREQQDLIDTIFDKGKIHSPKYFLDSIFDWISTKVIVLNKKEAIEYMVLNYNYRLVLVDQILEKSIS